MTEKRFDKTNSFNDSGNPTVMFRNRITRMSKHWKKWARKRNIECFRIYDRDIPQVPVSVDLYGPYCQISAYKNDYEISDEERERENAEIGRIVSETLNLEPDCIFLEKKRTQKRKRTVRKTIRTSGVVRSGGERTSILRELIRLSRYRIVFRS